MELSKDQQKTGMRHAIFAACCGTISEVLIRDSSVIILFATLLGAQSMFSMVTTSLMDLSVCCFMLPFAYLTGFVGKKKIIINSSIVNAAMIFLCAASPWFGSYSKLVLIGSLAVFSLFYSLCLAAWFPLVDGVVPKEKRGRFFGKMRFAWQTLAAIFFFIAGCFIGKGSSVSPFQIVIVICGVALLGQAWHITKIPEVPSIKITNLKEVIQNIIGNRKLVGFSVYLFFLYLAAGATLPTLFVFSKDCLHLVDSIIVIISSISLVGMLTGYLFGGYFVDRYGVKIIFLAAHFAFGLINILMLSVTTGSTYAAIFLGSIAGVYGFLLACASVAVSSEMLALSPKNNKAMSIAFCFSLYAAGTGSSRFLTSIVLGSRILAPEWTLAGIQYSQFHTLFLFYGVAVIFACVLMILVPALIGKTEQLPSI